MEQILLDRHRLHRTSVLVSEVIPTARPTENRSTAACNGSKGYDPTAGSGSAGTTTGRGKNVHTVNQ
jgi:hypothetical protein